MAALGLHHPPNSRRRGPLHLGLRLQLVSVVTTLQTLGTAGPYAPSRRRLPSIPPAAATPSVDQLAVASDIATTTLKDVATLPDLPP